MRWFRAKGAPGRSAAKGHAGNGVVFVALLGLTLSIVPGTAAQETAEASIWQRARSWWQQAWDAPVAADDQGAPHERVRNITARERELAQGTTSAIDAPEQQLRSAAPELSDATAPASTSAAGAGNGGGGFRPDRQTELNADVSYHETFDPAISPWKRLVALERIALDDDGVPVIVKSLRPELRDVTLSSGPGVGSEVFVGHVTLDFSTSTMIALPSVAPHAELFSVRASLDVPVRVVRDQSDNFYARFESQIARAADVPPVVLTFGMSAPRDYFGGALPDARVDALRAHLLPVPDSVVRDGLVFAAELGLSRRSTFRSAIETLTAHFRSFQESREPPPDTGNIYLDLARGRKGICRHRAYAFVLTAAALGIHARFVHNEAHAWVEVEVPVASNYPRPVRWLRIDLGGAAATPRVTGLESARSVHRPEVADTLPSPNNYTSSRAAMLPGNPSGQGTAQASAARANQPTAGASSTQLSSSAGNPTSVGAANQSAGAQARALELVESTAGQATPDAVGSPARTSVHAVVDTYPGQVQRGLEIELRGQVDHRGVCAIWIFATDENGARIRLGQALSRDGVFVLHAGVPPALAVGRYRIVPQVVRCDGS